MNEKDLRQMKESDASVDSVIAAPSDESPRVEQPDATRKHGLKIEPLFH